MPSLRVQRAEGPNEAWHRLVRERGTFYHDPRWVHVLEECFRYRIHWLVAYEGDHAAGVLALAEVPSLFGRKRISSLPFSYAAGPLAASVDVDYALAREAILITRERGAGRLELKRVGIEAPDAPPFVRVRRYSTYRVDATGPGRAFDRLHDSTRRGIRKAMRAGVEVVPGGSPDEWLAFARLQEETSGRLGVPPPPRTFYTRLARRLQEEGLARLYLARARGRFVAGAVVWQGPREWIYAFGASRRADLDLRPNHAVLAAALEDAANAGVTFDLGRAAPEQTGLVTFKRRWGGRPVPLAYDYWPEVGGLHAAPRDRGPLAVFAGVWSRLPTFITRLGSPIYRYLG